MNEFRHWALSLIIAAAAGTFAFTVSPRGSMDKTVRAIVGVFVVAAICSPLAGLLSADSSELFANASEYDADTDEEREDYLLSAFCSELETIIKSALSELGINEAEITADADIDADGCIIIHSVCVEIEDDDICDIGEIKAYLKSLTGIDITVK